MNHQTTVERLIASLCCAACLGAAGCSNLSGFAGLKSKSAGAPAQIGQMQTDSMGRPLPGSQASHALVVEEAQPEISDATRSHVALAMGEMLESVGNLNNAQMQYEQALKSDPKSLKAALALARIYARQGRPDAALKVYKNAEKHHRRTAALFNDKGLLLAEQKDWTTAIAALRTAVKLEPSESKYHNNLGMVLALSGNYEDAWKEFREAVGPAAAHYNVALMLIQARRTVEARNHLERALAVMPSLQQAQELLTQIDGRVPAATLTSEVRELEVDLDRDASNASEPGDLEPPYDSHVEPAAATIEPEETPAGTDSTMLEQPAENHLATEPAAQAESEETNADDSTNPPAVPQSEPAAEPANPWSKRWVPPKWLR